MTTHPTSTLGQALESTWGVFRGGGQVQASAHGLVFQALQHLIEDVEGALPFQLVHNPGAKWHRPIL